jgi:1-pyrroline-4-hydroxy-2-carboxylate deaminase
VMQGRIKEAIEINRWFMPLLELDTFSKLVQYIKLAEAEVGLGTETVRPPRLVLTGTERTEVLNIIRNALKNRPALPAMNGGARKNTLLTADILAEKKTLS